MNDNRSTGGISFVWVINNLIHRFKINRLYSLVLVLGFESNVNSHWNSSNRITGL